MTDVASPASTKEALAMMESAIEYLSAADLTQMAPEAQAQCLLALERLDGCRAARQAG